ncbi:uncharacterized protein BX663DRAFT_552533 [Cokeromyces recurvatus]|uniref:uncharacterized protein n=1 Tax=Cokeromyces recurvatus TaxID=90255 RepID=UPI00222018E8|nr:uncharacterized protein BX663DRAFT_552533 [Cokeromyces recurvatus]KAI7902105.1 hypothetical protein BX663DRAFT_552533 [Cokeromyces recurvatus]
MKENRILQMKTGIFADSQQQQTKRYHLIKVAQNNNAQSVTYENKGIQTAKIELNKPIINETIYHQKEINMLQSQFQQLLNAKNQELKDLYSK